MTQDGQTDHPVEIPQLLAAKKQCVITFLIFSNSAVEAGGAEHKHENAAISQQCFSRPLQPLHWLKNWQPPLAFVRLVDAQYDACSVLFSGGRPCHSDGLVSTYALPSEPTP